MSREDDSPECEETLRNREREEFDIDYATERRGQYDYRPDYTDKH